MNKTTSILLLPLLILLILLALTACAVPSDAEPTAQSDTEAQVSQNTARFHPVDCGVQAQAVYEYPCLGLTFTLPEPLLAQITSREVFVFPVEDAAGAEEMDYALLRFSKTTPEQREADGMQIDVFSWEASLERIGAIGLYTREQVEQLDTLTGCDIHKRLGRSADGRYVYYRSLNSEGDETLTQALTQAEITLGELHPLAPSQGYTAFASGEAEAEKTA